MVHKTITIKKDCFKAHNLYGFKINPEHICLKHEREAHDIITFSLIFNDKTLTNLIYENKEAGRDEISEVYSTIKSFIKKGVYEIDNWEEDDFFEFKIDPKVYNILKITRKKIKHDTSLSLEDYSKKLKDYEELKKNVSSDNPELADLKNVPYNYQTTADLLLL
ncbi:hypothetical protein GF352_00325 [archaeon]|nr:hypothetical protein [archaeon]